MTSEICTLFVELGDDGLIHISPNNAVDANQWLQIVSFWNSADSTAVRTRDISVQPSIFDARASWIRDSWKNRGFEVVINSNVLPALKIARAGNTAFLRLATLDPNRHRDGEVSVSGLTKTLTIEQIENILCLLDMKNGANFSVPGAGKTLTTLSLWQILKERGEVQKLLVVCPRSAFDAWQDECQVSFSFLIETEVFSGSIISEGVEVLLVNFEQLENPEKLRYLREWSIRNRVQLAIDEAHRIKAGGRSVRWRACKELAEQAIRVDLLTGTPMPQGPADLTALFGVAWGSLDRKALDEKSLISMHRKTSFVRTTKSELNLPELKIEVVSKPPSKIQAEIIRALRDQYSGLFGASLSDLKNLAQRGKAVMTLLAASTNPGLLIAREFSEIEMGFSWPPREVQKNSNLTDLVHEYLDFEIPWKFQQVAMQVEANARLGKKTLIWSSFVGNIAALKRVLTKFEPAVVFGATSPEDRENEIKRFRNSADCFALITNPQTLGEGISLHQECHDAIYLDRTYNAGLYLQSLDRIHRLGLKAGTLTSIKLLVTQGTIDERVSKRLELKIQRLASFLQDPGLTKSALPSADEVSPEESLGVTNEDLEDLFTYWVRD